MLLLALDIVAIAVAFFSALELRFEFIPPQRYILQFAIVLPVIIVVFMASLLVVGIYSRKWKSASFDEVCAVARAAFLAAVIILGSLVFVRGLRTYVPFSIAVLGTTISFLALSATRISRRLANEMKARSENHGGIKVLLVGAGEAGEMIARDMFHHPTYGYTPRAFVDDNPLKRNLILQGIPVSGSREEIPEIVDALGIEEIFITIPSASGPDISEIVDICRKTDARIKILPGITRTLQDDPGLPAMRELRVEDLLGREPVELDLELICEYLCGKVVLVTGAAGSIGSELSREILRFHPKRLLLLDNDESALFYLHSDLSAIGAGLEIVVADIREKKRIESIFKRYKPAIVFHSAALKHVPMMESNPCEAVKNNIMGTMNLADAAVESNCELFMLISTDKAVQPSSVMGSTKRLAELLMHKYNTLGSVVFGAVRFGNVLGSRGSVVPVFEAQIKNGGPVNVTHPEITRYFMTIKEAAQLVIQAGAYLSDGELFILDMGEPVKILDLAKKIIAIKGNGKPIDIHFTGLRPGEKLHEELAYRNEKLSAKVHPKIATINGQNGIPEELYLGIKQLVHLATEEREEESRQMLMDLVYVANRVHLDDTREKETAGSAIGVAHESGASAYERTMADDAITHLPGTVRVGVAVEAESSQRDVAALQSSGAPLFSRVDLIAPAETPLEWQRLVSRFPGTGIAVAPSAEALTLTNPAE